MEDGYSVNFMNELLPRITSTGAAGKFKFVNYKRYIPVEDPFNSKRIFAINPGTPVLELKKSDHFIQND